MTTRRRVLATTGTLLGAGSLAGCTGSGASDDTSGDETPDEADVAVGPGVDLAFEPESLTVSVGETVTWWFASPDHNVACEPEHDDVSTLPDGADAFASYDGDDRYRTEPEGSTFDHTFSTPGKYVYVCVPHIPHGMVGEIVVEE